MLQVFIDTSAPDLIGSVSGEQELLDKPYRSALIVAGNHRRRIVAKATGNTPRENLDWIARIGRKRLLDPKHVNNRDYAALESAAGTGYIRYWF